MTKSLDEYVKAVIGGVIPAAGAFVAAYTTHISAPVMVTLTLVAFATGFTTVYVTPVGKEAAAAIVAAGSAFVGSYAHGSPVVAIVTTVVAGLTAFSAVRWTTNSPPGSATALANARVAATHLAAERAGRQS